MEQKSSSNRTRLQAVNLALGATLVLAILKIAVAAISGSVGVLSEAIHSAFDLLSSLVTKLVVKISKEPADVTHPFGHGKLENLSAFFEAFLLILAGVYIVYEGIVHIHHGHGVEHIKWAMAVSALSMIVNLFVYFQNRSVGRNEESIAIETNAYHFLTDFFSSLGLLLGLALLDYTQWQWIDPVVAIVIAIYIVWVALTQIRKCIDDLSDVALPQDEVITLRGILENHSSKFIDYHDIRTRKTGPSRHIDMHLTVCSFLTVHQAHTVCDEIEDDIQKRFKDVHVNIHIEPCNHHHAGCETLCDRKSYSR